MGAAGLNHGASPGGITAAATRLTDRATGGPPVVTARSEGAYVQLLTDDEITAALGSLPDWERAGDSITRTAELADFRAAILFVNVVAYLAEQAGHHPDILVQWNKVTLTLSTHSAGGLTAADVALAGQINSLP
jgi:4a-hydroxytetrahydrobiopterin dehydratase